MITLILALLALLRGLLRAQAGLALENAAFRQQLAVYIKNQKHPRLELERADRAFWLVLRRLWSDWARPLVIVKPAGYPVERDTEVSDPRLEQRQLVEWAALPAMAQNDAVAGKTEIGIAPVAMETRPRTRWNSHSRLQTSFDGARPSKRRHPDHQLQRHPAHVDLELCQGLRGIGISAGAVGIQELELGREADLVLRPDQDLDGITRGPRARNRLRGGSARGTTAGGSLS